jgi:hypothetical protein
MIHEINKSWIEKTLIEGLKSLEFGKITYNPNKDYAPSCTTYPLPYCGHTCCTLVRVCSPIQTLDQTIRTWGIGNLECWNIG